MLGKWREEWQYRQSYMREFRSAPVERFSTNLALIFTFFLRRNESSAKRACITSICILRDDDKCTSLFSSLSISLLHLYSSSKEIVEKQLKEEKGERGLLVVLAATLRRMVLIIII